MSTTAPLRVGQTLMVPLFDEPMRVETVAAAGCSSRVVGLVGAGSECFRRVTMSETGVAAIAILDAEAAFNGDGHPLRVGIQAYPRGARTRDHVHTAMLMQSAGRLNALRSLITFARQRGPDFLGLANALSALHPKDSDVKPRPDAMLLAVPR